MSARFENGDCVKWAWGDGHGEGTVTDVCTDKVTRTIDGTEVTRDADSEEPAYMIEQNDGSRVLKSQSELQAS